MRDLNVTTHAANHEPLRHRVVLLFKNYIAESNNSTPYNNRSVLYLSAWYEIVSFIWIYSHTSSGYMANRISGDYVFIHVWVKFILQGWKSHYFLLLGRLYLSFLLLLLFRVWEIVTHWSYKAETAISLSESFTQKQSFFCLMLTLGLTFANCKSYGQRMQFKITQI